MKRLVIFDLDGTLLNTIDDLGNATNHALSEAGFPTHHLSAYPYFVGNGITRLIQRAVPHEVSDDETVIADLRRRFIAYYDEHLCDLTRPYEGIVKLLTDLTEAGVAVAVASNKYSEATMKLIRHFFSEIPWVAVEGQQEGVPVKPDPSIVFEIINLYTVRKTDILYVGDSGVDMETARRAGVESVGVTWGFRDEGELRSSGANHIVNSPAEILSLAVRNDEH